MKRILRLVFPVLMILALILPVLPVGIAHADGEDWLTGFGYRISVVFDDSAGAGTNYSVLLYVGESVAAGGDISLDGHTNDTVWSNGINDLRFTDNDGKTELDYWVDTVSGSGADELAKVWIEIADDLSGAPVTIYAYYGKSGQTTTSSIGDTFLFGDDFNRGDSDTVGNGWTELTSYIDSNALRVLRTGDTDETATHTGITYAGSRMYETKYKTNHALTTGTEFYAYGLAANQLSGIGFTGSGKINYLDSTGYHDSAITYTADTYYKFRLLWDNSDSKYDLWIDDVSIGTNRVPCNSAGIEKVVYQADFHNGLIGSADYVWVRKYISPEPAFASAGAEEDPSSVVTYDASDVTSVSAILEGGVINAGGLVVDERGFDWDDDVPGEPYDYNWTEIGTFGVAAFDHYIDGLIDATDYYYRAKAHTSDGWFYGEEQIFTTGTPTYQYMRKITVDQTVGAGTDYQVKVTATFDPPLDTWTLEATNPVIVPTLPQEGNNLYAFSGMIEGGVYEAWYGAFGNVARTTDAIYYATSANGLAWTKNATNPVFVAAAGGFDSLQVNDPTVVKVGNLYYMYYTGTAVNGHGQIGLATSTNRVNWTRYSGNPVLAAGYNVPEYYPECPTVIYEDGLFKLWYQGRNNIVQPAWGFGSITGTYYATSTDGINFTRHGMVRSGYIGNPEVKRFDANTLIMVSDSVWTGVLPIYVDVLTSPDGYNWTMDSLHAIGTGAWNPYGSCAAGLLQVGSEWRIYFGGLTNTSWAVNRIGLAYLSESGGTSIAYLDGTCRSDFGDVRFVENDGNTSLDYWMETYTDSDTATFWVEVSGDLDAGDVDIYICWGDSEASTLSRGVNTFIFFDDFNTLDAGTWDDNVGTPSVASGILSLGNDPDRIRDSTGEYGNGTAIRMRTKTSAVTNKARLGWSNSAVASNMYTDQYMYQYFEIDGYIGGAHGEIGVGAYESDEQTYAANTYYVTESQRTGTTKYFTVNDTLLWTSVQAVPPDVLNIRLDGVTGTTSVDWVLVRKFISPEPTITVGITEGTFPALTTSAADDLLTTSATLNGSINDMGIQATIYVFFQYGLTTAYGTNTVEQTEIAPGAIDQAVTGLSPANTYHYRIVARYEDDKFVYGLDVSFETSALGAPAITTSIATSITTTTVSLQGLLTSLGSYTPVYVYFQYGLTTSYGTNTVEQIKTAIVNYSQDLTSLTSGILYHFRAVVRYNTASYAYGSDITFTTTAIVTVLPPTNFAAARSVGQISLSWTKDSSAINTIIRRGTSAYPGTIADGVQVYFGTGSGVTNTGLTDTQGYFYSAWSEKDGAYTSTYATAYVAPLGGTSVSILEAPTTLYIGDVKVFRGYRQPNDQIIVFRYNIEYTTIPIQNVVDFFTFELYIGGTLTAKAPIKNWGHRPASIYFFPGSNLDYRQAFVLKVRGIASKWSVIPEASISVSSSDWDSSLDNLDIWVWNEAEIIDPSWVAYTSSGMVLTTTGCSVFNTAIPALGSIRPRTCSIAAIGAEATTPTHGNDYEASLSFITIVGNYTATIVTDGAKMIGATDDNASTVALSVACIVLFLTVGAITKNPMFGMAATSPLLVFGTYAAMIPFAPTMIVISILVLYAVKKIWL